MIIIMTLKSLYNEPQGEWAQHLIIGHEYNFLYLLKFNKYLLDAYF